MKLFGTENGNGIPPFAVDMDGPGDLMKLIKHVLCPTKGYLRDNPRDDDLVEKHIMAMKRMLMPPYQATLSQALWRIYSHWIWRNSSTTLVLTVNMLIKIMIQLEFILNFF